MKSESTMLIAPARNVSGALRLPGDKSISHRYAMLAAIAEGTSQLGNYSTGADCASTLNCLAALGCSWEQKHGVVEIQGRGLTLEAAKHPLDCGNSGSTLRMLSGILAGQNFTSELRGDASLSRRPMARIIKPLTAMGAQIKAAEDDRPPLSIRGGPLQAIDYAIPVASAQVKTAILFAGLFARGTTEISEPVRTRDHGELALRAFGAQVRADGRRASIVGGQKLRAIEATIPGDLSSSAFFLCAAALFSGSELMVHGVLMNPTRSRLLDVLIQMGAEISVNELEEKNGELVGSLQLRGKLLRGGTVAGATSAALIDELPVLAAIAPYTAHGIEIKDAAELRMKESDRIAAVAANLRAMGAQVEERPDGMMIPGEQTLAGGEVDSYGDHRIAMAFAVAALRAKAETLIRNADAARISYPGFFSDLEAIVHR